MAGKGNPAAAALMRLDVRNVAQRALRDLVALAARSAKRGQPINRELVSTLLELLAHEIDTKRM